MPYDLDVKNMQPCLGLMVGCGPGMVALTRFSIQFKKTS